MTTFPNSPRLMKGAIVGIDIFTPKPGVIQFQYNPDTLTRKLQARTDQLEKEESNAVQIGIYPQLSALEMLIYPKSSVVIANSVLLAAGTIEVIPPVAPLTLFTWGPNRVLPVRLTDFTITEEAHDVNLNPIRAKVSLSLQVLSYSDLSLTHPGYHLFLAHQRVKETMASLDA